MAVNMLQQMHSSTPGWVWNLTTVENAIQEINSSVSCVSNARITAWKRRSVVNLLAHIPTICKDKLLQEYLEWGWEHSFLNEDLLRQTWWKPGFKMKVSDCWQYVYTVSDSVLVRLCDDLSRWWKLAAPGTKAPLQEWQAAKPMKAKDDDPCFEGLPIALVKLKNCCVMENWLLPACIKAFGQDSKTLLEDLSGKMFFHFSILARFSGMVSFPAPPTR